MQAASSNAAPAPAAAAAATGAAGDAITMPLRACSTSGCQVSKYVEVTKRKCSQFVSAPYIMPKPLVVNGKTSIFQVGGEMAKLCDIPALSAASGGGGAGSDGQPIYRIKPGTHAHVINYVFIDEGSDSMEKAKSEDPEAMRMLLDSQRESATAKLQKLIAAHRGLAMAAAAAAAAAPAPAAPATPQSTAAATVTTTAPATVPVTTTAAATTVAATRAHTPTPASAAAAPEANITTPQIHPNLSIASVAGALTLAADATPAPAPASTPTPAAASNPAPAEDNTIDQLQAEILKLRRSLARHGGCPIP